MQQPDPDVARVASALTDRLHDLADELAGVIGARIDIYGEDAVVSLDRLSESVHENFTYMVSQLTTKEAPDLTAPRRTGRERAEPVGPKYLR